MERISNASGIPNRGKRACAVLVLCATTAIALPAQTFALLHTFNGADGEYPFAGLVQATNGYLYGTTYAGGANAFGVYEGTVLKMTAGGALTTIYNFGTTAVGGDPWCGLVQATNGELYGTTSTGGVNGDGMVFRITPGGTLTTLHSFDGTDGDGPTTGLIQSTDGNLYGTTLKGGACTGPGGCGTVFKMTPGGKLTTLYSFCTQAGCIDGVSPYAGLVEGTDGNFYGTTTNGGANCFSGGGCGTVFKITPTGKLTTLYNFCSLVGCTDGADPQAGLVRGADGNFYGTTPYGGANIGTYQPMTGIGAGTVFKITPSGQLTTLYSFCSQAGCTDGQTPLAGLVQGTDGNFYGTTAYGGTNAATVGSFGAGTLFKITATGTLTPLHNFCAQAACADGEYPMAGLVQNTNGEFYGTAELGGANCAPDGCGTVFSLSVGLGAFVETQTTSGKVGTAVTILGTNLKGATSVTFNGTPADFTVVSASEITTTVPTGATTGTVQVVTPRRTLSSNVAFRVP